VQRTKKFQAPIYSLKMRTLIIQGSARSNGNTHTIVRTLESIFTARTIDLKTKVITPYNYDHIYPQDDFKRVMEEIIQADLIIFATPVYWYTMSGIMKNFFDRMSDCLKIEKSTGRKLRGKKMAAISCGSQAKEIEEFFNPFKNIAHFLGLQYLGNVHTWINKEGITDEVQMRLNGFARMLISSV
jgi:multimeric flavodoxin WrbA